MNRHVLAATRIVAVVCAAALLVVVRDPVVVGAAAGVLAAVAVDLVRTWSARRRARLDTRIVEWLTIVGGRQSVSRLAGHVGRSTAAVFPALARLEAAGEVTSDWDTSEGAPGPYLRRRLYWAAPPPDDRYGFGCDIRDHGGCDGRMHMCQGCDAAEANVTPLRRARRDVRRG